MLSRLLVTLALTTGAVAVAQTPASPPAAAPTDARGLLDAAAAYYDFNAAELKPWHLKATYQIYDLKGDPAEQGTWERWWASPKVHRTSLTRAGATRTEWATADGKRYSKETGEPLKYFERSLEGLLLSPLPGRNEIDSPRTVLDMRTVPAGPAKLSCVRVAFQWERDGKPQTPTATAGDHYCFDPQLLVLSVKYWSNSLTAEFGQIVKAQGRYLPKQIVVFGGKQRIFSLTVDTIEGMNPADAALTPDAGLAPVSDSTKSVTAKVATGWLMTKTQPVYPVGAKMAGAQGTVVLAAVIGADGKVHDLEALASPSPLLTQSALDAVKQWVYKPYLANGEPVEVETLVNVIYTLGQ
ncbi:MAG: energy transducer TonB [Terracidiphilus sp.]